MLQREGEVLVVVFLSGLCLRRAGLCEAHGVIDIRCLEARSQGRHGEVMLGAGTFHPCRQPRLPGRAPERSTRWLRWMQRTGLGPAGLRQLQGLGEVLLS